MNKSLEDYLKNIYSIQSLTGKVTNTALAEKLCISPAAVSEMISKLSKTGHIENIPYKGFKLTLKGETVAINLVRKHRIWEVFLTEYLKYPWDKVHNEAENLEHSSSDELIIKLETFLNFPKYDPHGHPIPDKHGKIFKEKLVPLSEISINEKALIKQVSDESSEVLIYLSKVGLKLNDEIEIIDKINFDNSLQIHFRARNLFLSEKLSKNIYVSKKI